jgi:hypothetical protein
MARKTDNSGASKAKAEKKPGRISQIIQTYRLTKQVDPAIGRILLGTLLGVAVIGALAMHFVFGGWVFPVIFGLLLGSLVALIIFGRRAQASALSQIEGKPGAAASALSLLRRGWKVEPMIGFTKQQDVVTRLVGPPGIILIGEGNPNRLKPLMASERRKHERVASETEIHEVYVGDDEGQVPLRKLVKHVSKLGKDLKPAQMTDVLQRLKALDSQRGNIPMPKGPVPTSMKGMRGNLRGR